MSLRHFTFKRLSSSTKQYRREALAALIAVGLDTPFAAAQNTSAYNSAAAAELSASL